MFWDLSVAVAVAFVCSLICCRTLIGAPLIDMPDSARKAHVAPTPTSGGIGIALGFAAGLVALTAFSAVWRHEVTTAGVLLASAASAFAYAFLLLGFVDDAFPLGPRLKFLVFGTLSVAAAVNIGVVSFLPIGWGVVIELGFVVGLIGTALWVFTLVNCVNFMDGANGLAMGSVSVGLLALGAIALSLGAPSAAAVAICGAAALMGFLWWNFPNGRLFAGDSGALFAGALAALTSLVVVERGGLSPFAPPILFFPLLADALLTLAFRASRRRSLLEGHAEHLYQIAQRAGWGRRRIAVIYWVLMLVCGVIAFAVSRTPETPAAPIALGVLALIALVVSWLVRRAALKRGIAEI